MSLAAGKTALEHASGRDELANSSSKSSVAVLKKDFFETVLEK